MLVVRWINVGLRALMEAGIVAALGTWGWHAGGGRATKLALMIVAPSVVFGLWGAVDFRGAGRAGEALRLVEELVLSGLAALALYAVGFALLAAALAVLSVAHHALVYACGDRLLKART